MSLASARGVAALLAVVALAQPRWARAQGDAEDGKTRAKRLLASGSAKYEAGDFESALKDFLQAYDAVHNAKILFNIGQAYRYEKTPQPALAADAFVAFLDEASRDVNLNEKKLKEARSILRELYTEVDPVELNVTPNEAQIELDGARTVHHIFHLRKKGADDLTRVHQLVLTAAGYQPLRRDFTLAEVEALNSQKKKMDLALLPAGTAPSTVVINNPSTTVLVPMVNRPGPTAPPVVIREGEPKSTPDVPKATKLAMVDKPASNPDAAIVAPPPPKNHTPAFVALGIGGGLAASAAVFGFLALGQKNGLKCGDSSNPCVGADANTASSAHSKAQIADLLWLGATVAGGTGAILWFVAPGSDGAGGEVGVAGKF